MQTPTRGLQLAVLAVMQRLGALLEGAMARELPPLGPADGARSVAVGVAALGWGFFLPRRVFFLGNF